MSFLDDELADDKTLYAHVKAKITQITTGAQEFELNDGQVDERIKEADLETLLKLKSNLQNSIAEAEGDVTGSAYAYN